MQFCCSRRVASTRLGAYSHPAATATWCFRTREGTTRSRGVNGRYLGMGGVAEGDWCAEDRTRHASAAPGDSFAQWHALSLRSLRQDPGDRRIRRAEGFCRSLRRLRSLQRGAALGFISLTSRAPVPLSDESWHNPSMRLGLAESSVPIDGRQSPTALAVGRGTAPLLYSLGHSTVRELALASGRRADLVALSADGELWIDEIKSSVQDFRADRKWPEYRLYCDRLFFATALDVPLGMFPDDAGLILADAFGASILREAPQHRLSPATRKSMLLRFAHAAAGRLLALAD